MLYTASSLIDELGSRYDNPRTKLQRLVRDGTYTPVVRGLYESDRSAGGHLLAGVIRNPSYLSFEYSLWYHGLIPESVKVYTSATTCTHRTKRYETPFGAFTFRDVPLDAFRWGQLRIIDGGSSFWIASPEKALCDEVYIKPPVGTLAEMEEMLFEDLRIDEDAFMDLQKEDLTFLGPLYRCSNTRLLARCAEAMHRCIRP